MVPVLGEVLVLAVTLIEMGPEPTPEEEVESHELPLVTEALHGHPL